MLIKNSLNEHSLKRYWYFWRYVYYAFLEDGCAYRAAALTFTGLLALVPLMVVSFRVLAIFPIFATLGDKIQDYIFSNFVASSGHVIKNYLQNFSQQAAHLSLLGLIFLVISALLMLLTIEKALNTIWKVKVGRRGLSAFFRYWAVLTLAPLLISAGMIMTSYFFSLPLLSTSFEYIRVLNFAPSVLTLVGFFILYIAVPNCHVRFRDALIGAIVAACLFEIAKRGFGIYLTHFPTYSFIYGAFSVLPIFLVWVYLSWLILLLGAEICHARTLHYQYTDALKLDGFTQAYRWLGYLWQAQQQGQVLSLDQLVNQDGKFYQYEPGVMLQYLLDANLVERTEAENYVLRQDLTQLTLYELYQRLAWNLPEIAVVLAHDVWQENLAKLLQVVHADLRKLLNIPLADFYSTKQ